MLNKVIHFFTVIFNCEHMYKKSNLMTNFRSALVNPRSTLQFSFPDVHEFSCTNLTDNPFHFVFFFVGKITRLIENSISIKYVIHAANMTNQQSHVRSILIETKWKHIFCILLVAIQRMNCFSSLVLGQKNGILRE